MKTGTSIKSFIISVLFIIALSACSGGSGKSSGSNTATPDVPLGISASEGVYTDKVDVEWASSNGAASYIIYKSIDNKDKYRVIASNVNGISFTDENVTPDRIYFYKVAAANGDKWSEPSIDARGFAHTGKPMVPEKVNASENKIGVITITWSQVPQTDSYRIIRSESPNGTYTEIISNLTDNTYTDSDASLQRDKKYYYRIISVSNTDGESDPGIAYSGVALQDIPAIPSGVIASDGAYGNKVEIIWTESVNAVTYNIYRAPEIDGTAGTFEKIAENITGSLFEDVTAVPDNNYYYSVSSVSSGGESPADGKEKGWIQTGAPIQTAAPVNVAATKGNYDTISITWDAVEGSHHYTIYRSSTINGTYMAAGNSFVNSFTDTPPANETHFFYKVTSWSTGTNSVESYRSVSDEGYSMPQIPAIPAGITSTTNRSDGKIIVTWQSSAGAVSYRLYRSESADGIYNLVASGLTVLTYEDIYPSISVGKNYYYRISAVNVSGESERSSAAAGNTILPRPENFTLVLTGDGISHPNRKITTSWNAVTGATGYIVQRKVGTGSWADFLNTTATSCIDSTVSAGWTGAKTYYYRVKAINENTSSTNSDEKSIYLGWI